MQQIAVIGLGTFGYKIATTLASMGVEVIAVDNNEASVDDIKERVHQGVVADATDEKAMRAIGISEVDIAVIGIGEHMEESILSTVVLRRIGVSSIIARAISSLHGQVLREVGASRVVHIEEQMGEQIAKSIVASNVFEHITFPAGYSLVEVAAPKGFVGRTLSQLELRPRFGVLCVALQRKIQAIDPSGHSILKTSSLLTPDPAEVIQESDILVLVGSEDGIKKVVKL
jgi:trk system potassium uptake protein